MATYSAHFRVLDRNVKTKFSHFVIENFPHFNLPEEVKSFLLKEHPQMLHPRSDINFKLGYFVEGRGNRKFDIIDENTLTQAYEKAALGRITLWVDPHTPLISRDQAQKKRSANAEFIDEPGTSEGLQIKKSKRENTIEKHLDTLKKSHGDKFPEYKLRAWATMAASGSHASLESPPDVAFFDTTAEKKVSKSQPIEETIASAIAASFVAVQGQQNKKSVSKIESRGELMKQLKDVKDLLDSGIIDKLEYEVQRSTIMNELKAL